MMKVILVLVVALQTGLICFSVHLLMTGGTEVPWMHYSLIFLNATFGIVNVQTLLRY